MTLLNPPVAVRHMFKQVCAKDRQPSEQQLIMIAEEVRSMVAMQTESLRTHLLPELRAHGVRILSYADLSTSGAYG
jgi:polyphosphate kinase